MKAGIELINQERKEQILKHNRSIQDDVRLNTNGQLVDAATKLRVDDIGGYWATDLLPVGWDQTIWDKMTNKPYKDRLVISGALLVADDDRRVSMGDQRIHGEEIDAIASEIDRIQHDQP
jgi:hypothetical protein